jgi:GTP-binding protein HflX
LEEIAEADYLLHIVDVTHINAQAQAKAVYQTLVEIHADHIPVLIVLNKIDLLHDSERARQALEKFPNSVAISALTGEGLDDLLKSIYEILFEDFVGVSVWLPYKEGSLISMFHEQGQVELVEHGDGGMKLTGRIPGRLRTRFTPYLK